LQGARRDLHHPGQAVRIARVEPEWRIEQLLHRGQHALAREVEVMREPALGHEEAHKLLGGGDLVAILEHYGR
jgi:hypothetical protein